MLKDENSKLKVEEGNQKTSRRLAASLWRTEDRIRKWKYILLDCLTQVDLQFPDGMSEDELTTYRSKMETFRYAKSA